MSRTKPHAVLMSLLALVCAAGAAAARAPQQPSEFKPVRMKLPDGFMPAPFPDKKLAAGQLLLEAKRPAGMYVVYPKAEKTPGAFAEFLKEMVAGMFFHEKKSTVEWTAAPLPPHEGAEGETGTLYSAADDKLEIQLAAYTRTVGGTKVAYGYYAMRHKGGKNKDDGAFLDASGKGVKAFDKFAKSIREMK